MIFWALVGLFVWFLGRSMYRAAHESCPISEGTAAVGALLATIGAILFVVNVLRFAWSQLP